MKQRISSLDLSILARELQQLEGYRLNNIYNVVDNNRQFLLRFNKPDTTKLTIVVDCGFKVYLTDYERPIPQTPTTFIAKLRKHLKAKRLTSIKQVGTDRVLVLSFAEGMFHLVFEFFSSGNVILLDHDRKIMSLQRTVQESETNDKYAVGVVYNMFDETLFDEQEDEYSEFTKDVVEKWFVEGQPLHKTLFVNAPRLSSDLLQKNINLRGWAPNGKCTEYLDKMDEIVDMLNETQDQIEELLEGPFKGYIVTKKNPNYNPEKDSADLATTYEQFHPFEPILKDDSYDSMEISGYNKVLDKFFTTIDSTKHALTLQNQEKMAEKKIEQAKKDSQSKLEKLGELSTENDAKGQSIVIHADLVEECMRVVQSMIDQQMDWTTMEKRFKSDQARGNPIAKAIKLPLNLKQNKINLVLPDEAEVTVELSMSAYANASTYFNMKKSQLEKQKKAASNASKALKNIEAKISNDLKKKQKQNNDSIRRMRDKYFFEKYNWFLSNEGFLVLAGKSPMENDVIYSKYIQPDDILISNDYDKIVWIKNPQSTEVPPNTLMQAAILSLTMSEAWSKKIVSNSFWCFAKDISKFDGSGGVLGHGMFRYGQKNLLPPCQLVMGIAFLWRVRTDEQVAEDMAAIEAAIAAETAKEEVLREEKEKEREQIEESTTQEAEQTEQTISATQEPTPEPTPEFEASKSPETEGYDASRESTPTINKNVRGKKGKLKKMAKKYADQDDDERSLRLEALGTLKGVKRQEKEKKAEAERRIETQKRQQQRKQQQVIKFTKNEKVNVDYTSLSQLKGNLLAEDLDKNIDVVPVFAPWMALNKYKYKLKIQPGSMKKSKAVNDMLKFISTNHHEEELPIEHELMCELKDLDIIPMLSCDKVKLNLPK